MKLNRYIASCVLAIIVGYPSVSSFAVEFQSGPAQVSLLELYTSEGCSSCPPAEAWFSTLKQSPQLWKEFVPVAFHVDYWNYLGWRDPWSSKPFSDRQRAYAHSWKSDSVYTPGFVLNGKEWRGLSKSIPVATSKPGVLKMTSDDLKTWNVTFSPAVPVGDSYEVHVAMLTSDLVSDVKAGENRGRRLAHDFVVLENLGMALKPNSNAFTGTASFELKSGTGRSAVAVWITKPGQLEPLQATGGHVN